jgi:flagellar biosynthetic protein FliO
MAIALPFLTGLLDERATEPNLTRYLLVCGGLLAAILGVAYLFKRFFAGTVQRRAAKRSLRVVDVLPLGGKQKLVVVRCYDRSFLLGVGEKELSSIAELDVDELTPAGEVTAATEPAQPFRDALDDAVAPELVLPEPQAPWNEGRGVLA